MPSSRLTMAACEKGAPTSTTTADAATNSGVHAGSVIGAMRISPGCRADGSSGLVSTRARPRAVPVQPETPVMVSPASARVLTCASRRAHSSECGAAPLTTNGGTTSNRAR